MNDSSLTPHWAALPPQSVHPDFSRQKSQTTALLRGNATVYKLGGSFFRQVFWQHATTKVKKFAFPLPQRSLSESLLVPISARDRAEQIYLDLLSSSLSSVFRCLPRHRDLLSSQLFTLSSASNFRGKAHSSSSSSSSFYRALRVRALRCAPGINTKNLSTTRSNGGQCFPPASPPPLFPSSIPPLLPLSLSTPPLRATAGKQTPSSQPLSGHMFQAVIKFCSTVTPSWLKLGLGVVEITNNPELLLSGWSCRDVTQSASIVHGFVVVVATSEVSGLSIWTLQPELKQTTYSRTPNWSKWKYLSSFSVLFSSHLWDKTTPEKPLISVPEPGTRTEADLAEHLR